jgi:proline dehydrogenase
MFRQAILTLAANPVVSSVAQRYGMQLGAGRFVAGNTLDEAVRVTRDLNGRGLAVTLDHLGEGVRDPDAAARARDSYLQILDAIRTHGLDSNVSLKLTMMGLALDPALGYENAARVVEKAAAFDNFVRIDMEDSPYTDATLDVYRRLEAQYPGHVGVVLQAYLYRTPEDLASFADHPRNFRIVKGAYSEPASVAFPNKADVDAAYFRLVCQALAGGHHTAVATHDASLIGQVDRYVRRQQVPESQYEYQMLYGIGQELLERLARDGHRCRVYVPFGHDWYPYFTRRLAERPANLLFFGKALLHR